MFEQDIVNYFGMVMYNGRHKYFDSNIHFFHVLFDNQSFLDALFIRRTIKIKQFFVDILFFVKLVL